MADPKPQKAPEPVAPEAMTIPEWASALLERGDNVALARAARARLEDPEASEEDRRAARQLLSNLAFDPVALLFFGAGLVIWSVAFTLGVLLR